MRRAEAVKQKILARAAGLDASRIRTSGRGEQEPAVANDTPEGRQANRRVEFQVLNDSELTREIENRKLLGR